MVFNQEIFIRLGMGILKKKMESFYRDFLYTFMYITYAYGQISTIPTGLSKFNEISIFFRHGKKIWNVNILNYKMLENLSVIHKCPLHVYMTKPLSHNDC